MSNGNKNMKIEVKKEFTKYKNKRELRKIKTLPYLQSVNIL